MRKKENTLMSKEMSEAYKNLNEKVGKDKGKYAVYWIFVRQHRGIHQGYIGVSVLNVTGLKMRYSTEVEEAFNPDCERSNRKVHNMLKKFPSFHIAQIANGLGKKEALDLEFRLRPHDNYGKHKNPFNWNTKRGGQQ